MDMDELLFFGAMAWFLGLGVYTTLELLWDAVGRPIVAAVRRVRRRPAAAAMPCSCGGDMETCTCGTPSGPIPRHVPSWAKDGAQ